MGQEAMTLITQSEAARQLGISRQAVSDAIKRGALPLAINAYNGAYLYRKGRPVLHVSDVARYKIEVQRR
jgi:predicted DNA-binding protein (UPF0251 family)